MLRWRRQLAGRDREGVPSLLIGHNPSRQCVRFVRYHAQMLRRVPFVAIVVFSLLAPLPTEAQCPSTAIVQVSPTACKAGTATAVVVPIAGATYAWTVEGGDIVGDAGADHVTIAFGTSATATVSVTPATASCVAHGSGTVTLHDPFVVHTVIPSGHAAEPLTISWSYEN